MPLHCPKEKENKRENKINIKSEKEKKRKRKLLVFKCPITIMFYPTLLLIMNLSSFQISFSL